MQGQRRVFEKWIGDAMGNTMPSETFYLQDHLGSSTATLNTTYSQLSLEEYYPFGETSYGSYASKRYRYTGKERDDETSLYYYGARYYDAWTCRFVSVDPLADEYAYLSTYNYAGNNPATHVDIDGRQSAANEKSAGGGDGVD